MSKPAQPNACAISILTTVAMAVLLTASNASAEHGDCGQPVSKGNRPASVDALVALKTSIHLQHCGDEDAQGDEDDCKCDVDDSGAVTTRDSLLILRTAVGFSADLACDDSCGVTGSTLVPGSTTTTLSGDDDDDDDHQGDNDDGDDNGGDDDDGDHEGPDDSTTTTTTPL